VVWIKLSERISLEVLPPRFKAFYSFLSSQKDFKNFLFLRKKSKRSKWWWRRKTINNIKNFNK